MRYLIPVARAVVCGCLASCMLPYPSGGPLLAPRLQGALVAPPYALPTDATLTFDTPTPGASSGASATFGFPSNILETYQIVFTLPGSFTFDGFTALGPAGTVVASYAITTQGMTIPLRALTHDTAYADLYQNGAYEPGVDPRIAYEGDGVFRVTLPNGGDDQPLSTTAGFGAQAAFHLLAGILRTPAAAGQYEIQAAFTSVDPDGDGADDGSGTAPSTFTAQRSFAIACGAPSDCDDGSACTTDACDAGACTHDGGAPHARLDCELAALLDDRLCAPDAIVAGFSRLVRKKVSAARAAIPKLESATPKARKRLLGRMRRALTAIANKADHSRKLAPACRARFDTLVGIRLGLVSALPQP